AELVHHRIDRVLQLENFALHIDRDLLGKVAVGHGRRDGRDVTDLSGQVTGHGVHTVGEVLPRTGHAFDARLAAQLAFGADFAGHAGYFGRERAELIHHLVNGLGGAKELAL